ncbi:putative histidine kinase in two-component regulatory system [Thiomonas sp. X19]|uniref:diguanylate cyclase domain-containing protein n=1 Tax=Thiomonas sp. X19 TaxID=1050370 RepID=UPI000B719983|nr:diguanylate cyclase [Thiomonas sp. X19]SCC94586.1 putative histidine kinase in two-component regulatory system [Thiomonas sp. X19]
MVLAALRAQTEAEDAAHALSAAARSAGIDPLTQLPGRGLMLEQIALAIAHAKRHGTRLALLFLDLDNFKQVNDTLGHATGDEVLKLIATRLRHTLREEDLVGRFGGDEFLILLADIAQPSDVAAIADKVIAALNVPCRAGDHVVRLASSIGISLYPDDADDADALIDRADAAMYRAKWQRHGSYVFCDEPSLAAETLHQPRLAALQQPVAAGEPTLDKQERWHAELREANEHLVLAAANAQELQEAAVHAQRRQAEFIEAVAQELRSPLAPIRIATAMLGRVRADEPLLARAQSMIEQQVAKIASLASRLDDMTQMHRGELKLRLQVVDMVSVVDAAVSACRPAMDARLQQFKVHMSLGSHRMTGDPDRLVQILTNLIDNASRFAPDGGEIDVSVSRRNEDIVLTVSDNGCGIGASSLLNIFEPFVQDPQSIGHNGMGMGIGIGLTVVRALVEAHGGRVVARSAGRGLGSQFVVTLPLKASSSPHPDEDAGAGSQEPEQ